jgi:hypothetical protein
MHYKFSLLFPSISLYFFYQCTQFFILCVIHFCLLNYCTIHLPSLLETFYFQCYKIISVYFYFKITSKVKDLLNCEGSPAIKVSSPILEGTAEHHLKKYKLPMSISSG